MRDAPTPAAGTSRGREGICPRYRPEASPDELQLVTQQDRSTSFDSRLKYEPGSALDVINSARPAMIAAGFEYPYDYEPWHGQLPNIYSYPLVTSIPASASDGSFTTTAPKLPEEEEDEMKLIQATGRGIAIIGPAYFKSLTPEELSIATGLYGWPKDYGTNARAFDLAVSIAVNGSTADQGELDGLADSAKATIDKLTEIGTAPEVTDPPKA